jgi:hypothetical protein
MKCTKCQKVTIHGCFMNNCPVARLKFADNGKPIVVTKEDEKAADMIYGESPLVKAMPVIAQVLEAEKCKNDFRYWYNKYLKDLDIDQFKREYMQEPKSNSILEDLLPKHERERIGILSYNQIEERELLRLLCDYVQKDIRKHYYYIRTEDNLRGREMKSKVIMINGWDRNRERKWHDNNEIYDCLKYRMFQVIEIDIDKLINTYGRV